MKKISTTFILFFYLTIALIGQENQNSITEQTLDQYLQPFIENDLFSGVVLVAKDDHILINKAYGLANQEFDISNQPNTKFRIASISKAFTKLAIRQLEEQGKLNRKDALSKYIADYPSGKKITIEHLVNHASGIPHLNDFPNYDQLAKQKYTVDELISLFKDKPLEYESGAKETYSNSGYILLVKIIEKASNLDYASYLQKYIFQPAGMLHSGHEASETIPKNKAEGYMQNLSGKGVQKALYYDPSIKIGGGSIYSTTEDLFLFEKAFRAGKLSQSTEPLYDEGLFGKSPGFNATIWGNGESFVCILSNNYTMPMQKIGRDIVMMALGKTYQTLEINAVELPSKEVLTQYAGDYQIEDDLISIRHQGNALIIFENKDKWRANRLIPIGDHTFFDPNYQEKVVFERDEQGLITHFLWVGEKESLKVGKILKNEK